MNRCSGLLFATERLEKRDVEFDLQDSDFVGRNIAKCQLALGDALLAALGKYHWSCRRRRDILEQELREPLPGWFASVRENHSIGVEFKLHPVQSTESRGDLQRRHSEISGLAQAVWLWLENKRLNASFLTTEAYALSECDKCPETAAWKNRLLNLREFGFREAAGPRGGYYPRQRLLTALPLLLWAGTAEKIPFRWKVEEELQASGGKRADFIAAYYRLWSRYN